MLYQTTFQGKIFLIMLYYGIISGLILQIKLTICCYFKSKIFSNITDFLIGVIFGYIFIKGMNLYCYGEFRIYLLIAYLIGLIIVHYSLGFLIKSMIKYICKFLKGVFCKLKRIKVLAKIFK